MSESRSESYKAAGVDVTAGYEAVKLMKPMVESTYVKGVMGTLGGFGGLFRPEFKGMADPILVSGTDGVGTKLKLAFLMDKHDTVGIDCVAMCVNDIACCGAQPLFFLDYIAVGKNQPAEDRADGLGHRGGLPSGRLRADRRRDRRDAGLLSGRRVRHGRLLGRHGRQGKDDRRHRPSSRAMR